MMIASRVAAIPTQHVRTSETDDGTCRTMPRCRSQATPAEIKAAYRRMCILLHPDKHQDPAAKQDAERAFAQLRDAYAGAS